MSSTRPVKGRRVGAVNLAVGVTVGWLISAASYFFTHGAGGTGVYLLGFTVIAVAAWVWAIITIRADRATRKSLAELQALSPDKFEDWVGARLKERGYSVKTTGMGGDHGVDLLAEKPGQLVVVKCKRFSTPSVGEPILRDLLGAMEHFGANWGLIATTGQLTQAAATWAADKPIMIWDADGLVAMYGRHIRPIP